MNLYFKNFPERKLQDDIDLSFNSLNCQISKVEMIPALYERILSNLFYEASRYLIPNPSTKKYKKTIHNLSCAHDAKDHNQALVNQIQ